MMTVTTAYTDGACLGNPGPGGWGWVVPEGPYASGVENPSTNQRMEIAAAYEAVRHIQGPLLVVSDSTYVVKCFQDRWWQGWIKRGWTNSRKQPVANRDLWEPLVELVVERGDVEFRWVKGHSGDRWNDAADRLATAAAAQGRGRSGERIDAELLASLDPDRPGRPRSRTAAAGDGADGGGDRVGDETGRAADPRGRPVGRTLVVTGLHARELGGYADEELHRAVRDRLVEIIRAKRELHPDLLVLTGLSLGVEQLAAEAAMRAGAPHVAVLAYPDPDAVWPDASRKRFRRLLEAAVGVRQLGEEVPASRREAGVAMDARDATMAGWADEALVVTDGRDPRAEAARRRLERAVGDDLWRLDLADLTGS